MNWNCRLGNLAVFAALVSGASADDSDARWRSQLESLANRCRQLQLNEPERITRAWAATRFGDRQVLYLPSDAWRQPAGLDANGRFWWGHFRKLRRARAAERFALVATTAKSDAAAAYRLLHEVLREDPDHEGARRLLGYRRDSNGAWVDAGGQPSQKVMTRTNAALRFPAGKHWRIRSAHFEILTDAGADAGQRLADELETLHLVWRQAYFGFWQDADALRRRIASQTAPPRSRWQRHKVALFSSRQKYIDALRSLEPRIEVTIGIYLPQRKTSYFYWKADSEPPVATWRHEATHQLFAEHGDQSPAPGLRRNFWILEGVALHMESLQRRESFCTLGGWQADRLQFARYRSQPRSGQELTQLLAMGRGDMQRSAEIRALYGQCLGLTALLLDGQQGKYRDGFVELLRQVYLGRDNEQSLLEIVRQDPDALVQQYQRFLRSVTDDDVAVLRRPRNLCLRATPVTDAGLAQLQDVSQLRWFDATATRIGDGGLQVLSGATQLEQLMLEQSRATDQTLLQSSANWRSLEEIDLSQLAVTDAGVAALAKSCPRLKVLWLTGTQVTDRCIDDLLTLRQLTTLDVESTKISAAGRARLSSGLPNLR